MVKKTRLKDFKVMLLVLTGLCIIFITIGLFFTFNKSNSENDIAKFESSENTYYVSQNEEGASNENNGLYPYYKGDVNGPFKDLNFNKEKLPRNKSFKLMLRKGVYKVPLNGLHIYQSGNEKEFILITNFQNEEVVIDGDDKEIALKLDGNYIKVENLEIRNSKIYNIQVKSKNIEIKNNKIHGSFEDNVKILSSSSNVLIDNNEIYDFGKEGIDVFGSEVKINNNFIHSSKKSLIENREAHCFLAKGGSENVVFSNNKCEDVDSDWGGAIMLGGLSGTNYTKKDNLGNFYPQGRNIKATRNKFSNIRGGAVSFTECINCSFTENSIDYAHWGIKLVSGPNFDTKEVIISKNYFKIVNNGAIAVIEEPTKIREFDFNNYNVEVVKYILRKKSTYIENEEETQQIISNDKKEASIKEINDMGFERNSIFI